MDFNSFISVIIGGVFVIVGSLITSYLAMRGSNTKEKKEYARETIPLFYFLVSKVALVKLLNNNKGSIIQGEIINMEELADARRRLAYVSRAVTLGEIGEINSFCNALYELEQNKKDCLDKKVHSIDIEYYNNKVIECYDYIKNGTEKTGIDNIGRKIEDYFSRELKDCYK